MDAFSGAVKMTDVGISYAGSTFGGGTANRIGFRWDGTKLIGTIDNVEAYTLVEEGGAATLASLTVNGDVTISADNTDRVYLGESGVATTYLSLGSDGTDTRTIEYHRPLGTLNIGRGTTKGSITTPFMSFNTTGDAIISGNINTNANIGAATGFIEAGIFSNAGASTGCKIEPTGTVLTSTTTTSASTRVSFISPLGQVGRISTSGTTTAYVTSSDPRLKSAFTPITGALDMIVDARAQGMIGEFTFLSDDTQKIWGYNAHKLIDSQPTFGGVEGEGSRDDALGDDVTPAGVDQSKRVPILEAAIGELLDRIKVLESV